MKVYLDNAATTKPDRRVIEKMLPYLEEAYGNPSSIHSFGREVRIAVEEAREIVADFINADASEIYFCGNGTEANNFALFGIAQTIFAEEGKNNVITSALEHHCVTDAVSKLEDYNFTTELINSEKDFITPPDSLINKVNNSTSLVALMHTNNETGAVNDIKTLSQLCRGKGVLVHTDAVQGFGKASIDVKELGVNSLSASGHKIYGPKGIGITYAKSGTPLQPMIYGGSQERNRRGGTENPAAIIGFAEAVKIASQEMENNLEIVTGLKNEFVKGITQVSEGKLLVNGNPETTSPYIASITFPDKYFQNDAESMLMYLDINGIAASNGAACTSGTLKPSHVLLAAGMNEKNANGTIRFSFGKYNTKEEIDYTVGIIEKMVKNFSNK